MTTLSRFDLALVRSQVEDLTGFARQPGPDVLQQEESVPVLGLHLHVQVRVAVAVDY